MSIEVLTPLPGCCIAQTAAGEIQFGAPSDIIKLLQKKNIEIPSIIVLPDEFFSYGINQASIEFPLYYFLFVKQGFFKNEKFTLIGTKEQLKRVKQVLQLTLLGPTDKQFKDWKIPKASSIRKELNFMALKNLDSGKVAKLSDIIQEVPFKDNKAVFNGMTVEKTGKNQFTIHDDESKPIPINIDLDEKQPPPLPIPTPERRVFGGILAMRALNTLSGFDPHGYTTGFIMWVNGIMVSIDGVSWMKEHLLTHGISHEKLRTYILTHIHDDHSSIIDQIVSSKKVTIVTAKVVFLSFIHKLAAILDWEASKVMNLVNFIEVLPGEKKTIFGAEFEFWYTLHAIPTVGFKVKVRDKSYIFTGDMTYGKKLEEAYQKKIITKTKFQQQNNIPYQADVTKIFFDGGGGEIHPDPAQMKNIGKNVIFFHTGDLGPEMSHVATLAKAGTTWITIPSKQMFIDDFTTFDKSPLFEDCSLEWQRILLNSASIENYNSGDFVTKPGEKGGAFYLILAGTFYVISENKIISSLQEGDFFGDAARVFNKLRNISIKVGTPGAVLKFPGDLFYQYALESGIDQKLKKIEETKPLILKIALFQNQTPGMMNKIAEIAQPQSFNKGEVIIHEGDPGTHFFVIQSGKVHVEKMYGRKRLSVATLSKGQFVGEMGILGPVAKTTASVIADTRIRVLAFEKEQLEEIIESNPFLNLTIGKVMDKRFDENRKTGIYLKKNGK